LSIHINPLSYPYFPLRLTIPQMVMMPDNHRFDPIVQRIPGLSPNCIMRINRSLSAIISIPARTCLLFIETKYMGWIRIVSRVNPWPASLCHHLSSSFLFSAWATCGCRLAAHIKLQRRDHPRREELLLPGLKSKTRSSISCFKRCKRQTAAYCCRFRISLVIRI
jgi:hypothetical protein